MKSKLLLYLTLIGLLVPLSALADIIYEFSLEANGEVDAINIQLATSDFLPVGFVGGIGLADPSISFTAGNGVVDTVSVIGVAIAPLGTLYGISLRNLTDSVLGTPIFLTDFFAFDRAFDDLGTFTSVAGIVISDLALDTANPVATLRVYDDTAVAVPAPPTLALIGLALVGLGWLRHRKA